MEERKGIACNKDYIRQRRRGEMIFLSSIYLYSFLAAGASLEFYDRQDGWFLVANALICLYSIMALIYAHKIKRIYKTIEVLNCNQINAFKRWEIIIGLLPIGVFTYFSPFYIASYLITLGVFYLIADRFFRQPRVEYYSISRCHTVKKNDNYNLDKL